MEREEGGQPKGQPSKASSSRRLGCGVLLCLGVAVVGLFGYTNYTEMVIHDSAARVRSDMRTIATALEAYAVDNEPQPIPPDAEGPYPPYGTGARGVNASAGPGDPTLTICTFALRPGGGTYLTTPVPYLGDPQASPTPWFGKFPRDRFSRGGKSYFGYYTTGKWWVLQSAGPDGVYDVPDLSQLPTTPAGELDIGRIKPFLYDSTNGTKSGGDILSMTSVGPLW